MNSWDSYRISQVIPLPQPLYVYSGNDDGSISRDIVACSALVEVNGTTELTPMVHAWGRIVAICELSDVIAVHDSPNCPLFIREKWVKKIELENIEKEKKREAALMRKIIREAKRKQQSPPSGQIPAQVDAANSK